MKQKGQIGLLLSVFVGVVFAVALITGSISDNLAAMTSTVEVVNQTLTLETGNTTINLNGKSVSDVFVINGTSNAVFPAGNFTTANNQIVNGELTATLTRTDFVEDAGGGSTFNVTYTFEPATYVSEASGRTITDLIMILTALALAAFVIGAVFKDQLFDLIGR